VAVALVLAVMLFPLLQPAAPVAHASPDTESLSPDGLLVQTNLSGLLSDIQDDPDSPDGNWLTRHLNHKDTVCRVSFPTPSGNPTVGADLQEFKIWVRQQPDGEGADPTVRIELYENGSSLATILTDTAVSSPTGALYSGTWNANLLSNADGSGVECYIYGTAVGGPPKNRCTVEVGAVEWNVDYTAPAPTLDQNHYRWRNDDGSESAATWKAAEDTPVTGQARCENVRLRFSIKNTGGVATDYNYRLYVSENETSGFTEVPTATAGCDCSVACMTTSDNFTNQESTTRQLSIPDTFTWTAGKIVEDPSNQTNNTTLNKNCFTEVEFNFRFTSNAASNTTYYFRVANGKHHLLFPGG